VTDARPPASEQTAATRTMQETIPTGRDAPDSLADIAARAGMSRDRAEAAKRAVAVVFGVNGFLFASWVSRLPAVRDLLHLTPARLGLLLLCISVGSVATLLASGVVVHRLGPRGAVLVATSVMAGALAVAATTPPAVALAVALVLMGAGTAVWDVAMNVEGALVERILDRPVMPRFHAGFSLGTVGGAGVGAAAAAGSVPVWAHLILAAALGWVAVVVALRLFTPSAVADAADAAAHAETPSADGAPAGGRRSSGVLRAWREPRTLMIGLLVLGSAFAEGAANDWLAVGLVDGYGVDHALAALGFGLFVTAMTLARVAGTWFLQRLGRVVTVRAGAALVAAGVLAVVLGVELRSVAGDGVALAVAAVGALAWGTGAALGFPIGMSAAADDARSAAARVSVVSAIGYVAFLAGPPFLGLLGDHVGVVRALLGVVVAVLLSLVAAGAARPLPTASPRIAAGDE
jgi:fucose permease